MSLPHDGSILTAVAALAVVLALIWGGQRLVRLRLPARGGRRLALAETIALDARRRLHLVRCDGRYLLVQTGGPQDLLVGWLPTEPPAADLPVLAS